MSAAERFRRADALFDAALDLAPGARAAYVAREAGADDELRRDVERLLSAHDRSAGFLDTPAAGALAPLLAGPDAASAMARLQRAVGDAYVIEREAGRGGMATVYLARDVKHERRVAIKLLAPELGALVGADRFAAEIRVTAGLQHPNVLPLFDSGGTDDALGGGRLLWYVMPFVDGETLRARLGREGPLPVADVLRIATSIARALDYAHRHGVVHRDLKPENVLLQDGEPLVADFGIALALSQAGGARLTHASVLLGTPHYMSPEQAARGRPVDARSDVYSLGVLLYEMLAGAPPFAGGDPQLAMARALTETPRPLRAVRPAVPAHVEAAVARALERLPADRFATARELSAALVDPRGGGAARWTPSAARGPLLAGAALATVVAVAATGWVLLRGPAAPPPRTARFVVGGLADPSLGSVGRGPTLTADGRALVYTGFASAGRPVLVRPLDALEARAVPGTAGAFGPFVSPDGQWIGFFTADDKLEKVPTAGGAPTVLGGAFRFSGGRWADGAIVLETYGQPGLVWLRAAGGPQHLLTHVDTTRGERQHGGPLVLDDGRTVLFTVGQRFGPGPEVGELAIATLDTLATGPAPHRLIGVQARVAVAVVDGWLLYVTVDGRGISAVRFDAATGRARGAPVVVLEDAGGDVGGAALGRDGTLVYTRRSVANAPVMVSETGVRTPLLDVTDASFMNPRLSPDGRRLSMLRTSADGNDVWVYDIASRTPTRLTSTGNAVAPTWTPDGRRIVFVSNQGGSEGVWWQPADGSGPAERLVAAPGAFQGLVSPDGRTLLFQRQVDDAWQIWTAPLDGDRVARQLLHERFDAYMPAVSPDGHWLAYTSNATGRAEVFVRPFPASGAAVQVSERGGTEPAWSPDGRRLFYRGAGHLVAATISATPALAVLRRDELFADDFAGAMPHCNFAVTPDGHRFVMIASPTSAGPETVVVVDWMREVKGKLKGQGG